MSNDEDPLYQSHTLKLNSTLNYNNNNIINENMSMNHIYNNSINIKKRSGPITSINSPINSPCMQYMHIKFGENSNKSRPKINNMTKNFSFNNFGIKTEINDLELNHGNKLSNCLYGHLNTSYNANNEFNKKTKIINMKKDIENEIKKNNEIYKSLILSYNDELKINNKYKNEYIYFINQYKKQFKSFSNQINANRSEYNELRKKNAALKNEISAAKDILNYLVKTKEILINNSLSKYREEIKLNSEKEKNNDKDELNILNKELNRLIEIKNIGKNDIQSLSKRNKNLQEQIEKLESQLKRNNIKYINRNHNYDNDSVNSSFNSNISNEKKVRSKKYLYDNNNTNNKKIQKKDNDYYYQKLIIAEKKKAKDLLNKIYSIIKMKKEEDEKKLKENLSPKTEVQINHKKKNKIKEIELKKKVEEEEEEDEDEENENEDKNIKEIVIKKKNKKHIREQLSSSLGNKSNNSKLNQNQVMSQTFYKKHPDINTNIDDDEEDEEDNDEDEKNRKIKAEIDKNKKSKDKSRDKIKNKSKDKSEDKSKDKNKDKNKDKDKSKDKSNDKSKDKSKDKSNDKIKENIRNKKRTKYKEDEIEDVEEIEDIEELEVEKKVSKKRNSKIKVKEKSYDKQKEKIKYTTSKDKDKSIISNKTLNSKEKYKENSNKEKNRVLKIKSKEKEKDKSLVKSKENSKTKDKTKDKSKSKNESKDKSKEKMTDLSKKEYEFSLLSDRSKKSKIFSHVTQNSLDELSSIMSLSKTQKKLSQSQESIIDILTAPCKGLYLYTITNKGKLLSFNITQKKFAIIDSNIINGWSSFIPNYLRNIEGSLLLNTLEGLFIVTGTNFNELYFYSQEKNLIAKIMTFNFCHKFGGLLLSPSPDKNLYVIGGDNEKNEVEFLSFENDQIKSMPNLLSKRINSSFTFINNKLYAIFGEKNNTIEYLNIKKLKNKWTRIDYKMDEQHLNRKKYINNIYGHISLPVNDNDILIVGGNNNKKMMVLDLEEKTIDVTEMKVPFIDVVGEYLFDKDKFFNQTVNEEKKDQDGKNIKQLIGMDTSGNVHIFDYTFNYVVLLIKNHSKEK